MEKTVYISCFECSKRIVSKDAISMVKSKQKRSKWLANDVKSGVQTIFWTFLCPSLSLSLSLSYSLFPSFSFISSRDIFFQQFRECEKS